MSTEFELGCKVTEGPKNHLLCQRWRWIFTQVSRISTIRQGQIDSKTVDSKAVLHVIKPNPVSCTWRVSGELGFSQSCGLRYLHVLGVNTGSCLTNCATRSVLHVTIISQNFCPTSKVNQLLVKRSFKLNVECTHI